MMKVFKILLTNNLQDSNQLSLLQVEEGEENDVSQLDDTDEIADQHKEEGKLDTFWKESDELVINAPTGHKLKDIAKYEVVVSNTLEEENLSNVDVDKKVKNILDIKSLSNLNNYS